MKKIGEGTSLGRFVKKGVQVVEKAGYPFEVGGMSTRIEAPDLDALFGLTKQGHAAHVSEGAQRIVIDLKADDRRDKKATIASKKASVRNARFTGYAYPVDSGSVPMINW